MNESQFKSIRVSHGYTQKELGDYLGFTETHISFMENGHKKIVKRTELAMKGLPHNDSTN